MSFCLIARTLTTGTTGKGTAPKLFRAVDFPEMEPQSSHPDLWKILVNPQPRLF